jgi:hypothetical protein
VGIIHGLLHRSAHTPTHRSRELQTHNKQRNGPEATLNAANAAHAAQQPTWRCMQQHSSKVHVLVLKNGFC